MPLPSAVITMDSDIHGVYECTTAALDHMILSIMPGVSDQTAILEKLTGELEERGGSDDAPRTITEALMILAEFCGYATN